MNGILQRQVMTLKDSQQLGRWDRLNGYLSDCERPSKTANNPVILFVLYGNKQNTFGDHQRLAVSKFGAKSSNLNTGSGLDKPTDRDQWGWVFLNYPKILCHWQKTQKILSEKQNPKTSEITIHLIAKVKHNMIIMKNSDYWSAWYIKLDPKILLKIWNT